MRKTVVRERSNVVLKNPILVEGLPGLGTVGKIAVQYLRRQMKAKRLAELYSPHFAYYVLVTKRGSVRLLRNEFHYWQNEQR
ncbi:MAG: PAC2 family protein, partial [Candidatus Bathyarchaeota archaeon]|nr:PAC2 family protein [Candidatus Bathyarchaeota archaeon]